MVGVGVGVRMGVGEAQGGVKLEVTVYGGVQSRYGATGQGCRICRQLQEHVGSRAPLFMCSIHKLCRAM